MNKKFMVVALMVALSATGYGALNMPSEVVDPTYVENGETKVSQQIVQDNVKKINQNFKDVYIEVANKVNADEVYNKEEVYTKTEVNNTFATKTEFEDFKSELVGEGTGGLLGELNNAIDKKANQTEVETIKNKNQTQDNRLNKIDEKKQTQDNRLDKIDEKNQTQDNRLVNHEARITHLEDRVDRLDEKMNEGLSLMAAMNAVDFQNVEAGEMAIGAGFGHYGNAQSVAVGVAYAPTDNFNVNVKYSATAGNPESFAIGAGASYKFKVGR